MKGPIISISGVRGILGVSLTPDVILRYSEAFLRFTRGKRFVIGRDGRLSGDSVEKIVESTLLFNGCQVINLGMVPTPTVSLAVKSLKADGGISITASHNPQEWNGLKFINKAGLFLDAEELAKILKHTGPGKSRAGNVHQLEYYPGFTDHHIGKVLKIPSVDAGSIRKRKFKVVADCINSSGSYVVPKLLQELGCTVYKVDCDGSGIFSRDPEPLPEHLGKTCRAVRSKKADLGIVVDPDTDRLVIITENGSPFIEENTIVTVIKRVLTRVPLKKRVAVVNLSTTRAADDIVEELGGKLYRAPVGEINVVKKMMKTGAAAGGEGSGGVIIPEVNYGRDALAGIAVILSEFAEFGGRISEYKKRLPAYSISKKKIRLSGRNPGPVMKRLKLKYKDEKINSEDGLRIDFKDSWVSFRMSNTEPVLRIITEARTRRLADELMRKFSNELSWLK